MKKKKAEKEEAEKGKEKEPKKKVKSVPKKKKGMSRTLTPTLREEANCPDVKMFPSL